MLKRLAIVGLLLIPAPMVAGQPNQTPNSKQEPAKQGQPAGPNKQASGQANQSESDPSPPKWYAPLERPDWWLVVLGFGTLAVVSWQTRMLARSVKAAQTAADAAETSAKAAMGVAVPTLMLHKFSFIVSKERPKGQT
jgi:hypothetical protein